MTSSRSIDWHIFKCTAVSDQPLFFSPRLALSKQHVLRDDVGVLVETSERMQLFVVHKFGLEEMLHTALRKEDIQVFHAFLFSMCDCVMQNSEEALV